MMRVIQSASRVPNTTDSSPPMIGPSLSASGRPELSTSRQTTRMLRATAAGTARLRHRCRKTCGYRPSRSEK
jgi:hypothetical protein